MTHRPQRWRAPLAVAWLALPGLAQAHSAAPGANAFYSGLLHPLQNWPQILLLLALGIMLGQRPPLRLSAPMLAFTLCCGLALLLTTLLATSPALPQLLMGLALGLGVLIAAQLRLPLWSRCLLLALAGAAIGLDSGVDGAPSSSFLALALLGSWISTSVLVANIAYYVSLCPPRKWVQIGIRIAGSWIAAASVLVLAFLLKGQQL
ncbi:HupE/UreJ family protein [Rhodoferax sp.]|uniref:HupE/UreJ family protein n=1 Tax=Rhodoferax sp. TaxID=50421 RepID=UPI00374C9957